MTSLSLNSPAYDLRTDTSLPEYALRVTGTMRLVLVINLGSFVVASDTDAFRHIRGSEVFAGALRDLHPQAPFGIDDAVAALERDAYALRIFRSRLIYNHFFPTFRAGWDEGMRERLEHMGCTDIQRWQRCISRVRLTRNGLAVVILEQALEDEPLINCTARVLELPSQGTEPLAQEQWSLGMTLLRAFLDSIGSQITLPMPGGERTIHFTTTTNVKHTLRLDRYVIYSFSRIEHAGRLISPEDLKRDYAPTLGSFMEGALVECAGQRRYPSYAADQAQALVASDASSWADELCLFTGESALLYYPLIGRGLAYVGGPLGLDGHAYGAYWAGIGRGVEHLVAFRSESQQAERRTTDLLRQIPVLTRKVNDGNLGTEDIDRIDHLAAGLSDIFDSLPEMRSMAVSTSAFRADYVRRKFEVLLHELHVQETLELVNTNVEQLDFFLSYYNDMRLQWQGQRTNGLALMLGVIVLFMAVSSFLADTFNVVSLLTSADSRDLSVRDTGFLFVISVVALVILGIMLLRIWRRFGRKTGRRGPRRIP